MLAFSKYQLLRLVMRQTLFASWLYQLLVLENGIVILNICDIKKIVILCRNFIGMGYKKQYLNIIQYVVKLLNKSRNKNVVKCLKSVRPISK